MSIIGSSVTVDPNRAGHVGGVDSGGVNPLYAEEHFGDVERRMLETSFMRQHLRIRTVRGTDTLTSRRMGAVSLQKLERGKIPTDNSPTYDSISIKVDTIVLARATEFTLEDFQTDKNFRTDISEEQGDELGIYFDQAVIAQAVKASQITIVNPDGSKHGGWEGKSPSNIERGAPEGHVGGTVLVLPAAGDEDDPVQSELTLRTAKKELLKKNVREQDLLWLVNHDWYEVLSRNENLITTDLNNMDNGSWSAATVHRVGGIRLHSTNHMPAVTHVQGTSDHFLSNASNGYAYNNTANDIKCLGVLISIRTLLAGETIPLTTKIWFDDLSKMWYIDAWTSFAVTPNRPEVAAAVFTSGVS
jgi:hypothetical protein